MPPIPLWYFAWGLPWALAAGVYAYRRSRSPIIWALLGFFFAFVAVLALWIMGEGAWHLEGGHADDDRDLVGPAAGETVQAWRTPPSSDKAAAAAWWTSADAGSLGHRSKDGSRRS